MTNQALTFEAFKATRRNMTSAKAAFVIGISPEDLGDDPDAMVAVFHANAYGFITAPGKLLVPIYSTEFEADDDAATWALYWDFYLPECHQPEEIGTAVLTDALREFCAREKLPHKSADELLADVSADVDFIPETAEKAAQIEAIEWFIRTWDAALEAEDDLKMFCPDCGHTGSFMVAATIWGMRTKQGFDQDHCALPNHDSDYDEYAACICPSCNKHGIVQEFQAG
jgi:hypothetical protein